MQTYDILLEQTITDYINAHPSLTSNQRLALGKINSYSNNPLIQSNLNNPLVFFFEGAGSSQIPTVSLYDDTPSVPDDISYQGYRYGAMAVVIQSGVIKGVYTNTTTLPDQPKGNACNAGRDVPTLRPGVYKIVYTTHGQGKNAYAALNVVGEDNNVVRFATTNWYLSRSDAINIHKGPNPLNGIEYFSVDPNDTWAISSGCILVDISEYSDFAKTVGFDKDGDGRTDREDKISGCVIVDRTLIDITRSDLQYLYGNDGLALISGYLLP